MTPLTVLLRRLGRRPGYTATATLILGLGLGANLTIFSLVRGVLLRPLPFPDEGRLVSVASVVGDERSATSPPDFADFRQRAQALSGLAAASLDTVTLAGDPAAEQVPAAFVTSDFFAVLGVQPALGRTFTTAELAPGAGRALILSHALWQRRFGGDAGVVGRALRVGGEPWTVAGVMPPGFDFPRGRQVWVPLAFDAETLTTQRGAHFLMMIGRLRPKVTVEGADAELRGIAAALAREYPRTDGHRSAAVVSLREAVVGHVRPQLLTLQWAVLLVLLMAVVNVTSLMLARVLERRREVAVRTALGASRSSLVGDVLGESLLLGGLAALLGVGIASWLVGSLRAVSLPLPRLFEVRVDGLVLVAAGAGALAVAALVMLVPCLRVARRLDLASDLDGSRSGEDRHGLRLRGLLIVAETAIAVVLLFGAMLMGRSFLNLSRVAPGFQAPGVLTFSLALPAPAYPQPDDRRRATRDLLDRLAAIPGVQATGVALAMPLSGDTQNFVVNQLDGAPSAADPSQEPQPVVQVVSRDFLRALGVPLERGRTFAASDRNGRLVCLLDGGAAALLWPGHDALGHTLRIGTRFGQGGEHAGGEVIGIVGRVHQEGLAASSPPTIYVLYDQFPIEAYGVAVRSTRPAPSLEREVRTALQAVDPTLAAANVRPLASYLRDDLAEARLHAVLLGLFGAVAVLLAAIGLYGVLAFAVLQSRREVAIRMALGSSRAAILRRFLWRGVALGGLGLAIGLAAALPLAAVLRRWLYALPPQDPWSATIALLVLLAVTVGASLGPAWRATAVDPATTLRE